jgi:hypothetical protein
MQTGEIGIGASFVLIATEPIFLILKQRFMTTTKFILLATGLMAGTAAYWLTRKKNAVIENEEGYKRERHLTPAFSKIRKQVMN